MKVAVLSDIHGNLPALKAVVDHVDQWRPDIVVVDGDIVNRGPRSRACFDLVFERHRADGWQLLRGNHEEFVLDCASPDTPTSGPAYEMTRFAHFALEQLGRDALLLGSLPDIVEQAAPDGEVLRAVHASMQSNRDGIYPTSSDEDVRRKISPAPAVFVTGHTHRPLIRQVDQTLVVNIGSVGAPFDHDRRAAYGQFTWNGGRWEAEIVRLDYDYEQIESDYATSGFLEEGGPLAQLMLVELRMAHSLIFRWTSHYEAAVLAREMTLAESVRQMLGEEDLRPYTGPPGWII